MITLSEENYLKAIFYLANEKRQININEISKFLNIKMPSVNSMMKKFAERGWVIYKSYKPLQITDAGICEAAQIVRKHRLTEMFLTEKMGFGWEQVHDIAEQIEHIKSDLFFDRIDKLLNFPKVDPHGSPIPDKNGNIIHQNYKKLSECDIETTVTFRALIESSKDFLEYLNLKELSLGTKIKVLHKETFDNNITISYLNRVEIISNIVAEKLLVEP